MIFAIVAAIVVVVLLFSGNFGPAIVVALVGAIAANRMGRKAA